jgi:hypothetical protein
MKRQGKEYWEKRVAEQQDLNISAKEYCRRRSLSRSTFLRWRQRIDREAAEHGLVEIAGAIPRQRSRITVSIRLGNGLRIDFHDRPDPDTLGRLIVLIRSAT